MGSGDMDRICQGTITFEDRRERETEEGVGRKERREGEGRKQQEKKLREKESSKSEVSGGRIKTDFGNFLISNNKNSHNLAQFSR